MFPPRGGSSITLFLEVLQRLCSKIIWQHCQHLYKNPLQHAVAVLQENKDVTNLSFPAAAEEMKQLQ